MKNLVLSMLAMASISVLSSCSSENDVIDEVTGGDQDKVEIKLNTGVGVITTKADAVTDLKDQNITILRQDGSSTPSDWTTYSGANYTVGNDGSITLNSEQKYYDNSSTPKNSYFIGIYPQVSTAPTSGNTITFTNEIGDHDILCSQVYDAGSKISQTDATTNNMKFDHMLSQVKIQLEATTSAATAFGKVKKIIIKNMPKALDLSLKDKTITANATPENTNMTVYDNASGENIGTATIPDKFLIPGLGKLDATDLQIIIVTDNYNTDESKTITISGIKTLVNSAETYGTLAGYKHTIKITFNDNISISTEVNSIQTGGEGSGNVEN
ncbi:fimbrillin family protein [uncultured Parabacteroides sp.]|uniref:fimbrillin family protein n=1 Tax=uncultured Parabacteroides sp. TaxID=512312 RepID=UPI0025FC9743|nr:fimbrillin family protein [uncultured Parabacteroides sp.]